MLVAEAARPNGKAPLYLTLVALGGFIAAGLMAQPYSANWPGTAYAGPARRYLQAAVHQDSLELRRLSLSLAPVAWALAAGRAHRLDLWGGRVEAWTGERRGDTTEVFVYPLDHACETSPVVFRFVGIGADAKVVDAASTCVLP
jgi:hypothetical protein